MDNLRLTCLQNFDVLALTLIVLHRASGTVALARQADEECLSLLQAWKC